jgi:hypothetical protein
VQNYSLKSGTPVVEPDVVISGATSLRVSSYGQSSTWFEFLTAGTGRLTPGFAYTARLGYRVVRAAPDAKLYMLFRSEGKGWGAWDRGWTQVDRIGALVGEVGTLTGSAGLDNRFDYALTVGLSGEAEVVIDDITVSAGEEYHEPSREAEFRARIPEDASRVELLDFEDERTPGLTPGMASLATESALSGTRSLVGDTRAADGTWNVFYTSPPGYFAPDNVYYVMMKYRVLARAPDSRFYALIRTARGTMYDVIVKEWKAPPGAEGEFHFASAVYFPYDDYRLSLGVVNKGAVMIDDIEVVERERGENAALRDRPPFDTSRARLVWEDDFDGDEIDPARWSIVGDRRRRGGMWRRRNCTVDGTGNLVLRSDRRQGTYNGGCIESRKMFRFGYFEARIKLDAGRGHGPAFWLMDAAVNRVGNDGRDGTEIDIVESPWRTRREVSHALHWDGYGEDHRRVGVRVEVDRLDEGYHTFAVDWFEHGYVFYVDGKETWRTYAGEVCQVPLRIFISNEPGGGAGMPDDAVLPGASYVDWVRVYEAAP